MQLVYGNVQFAVNAAKVTYRTTPVLSQAGRPIRYIMRVDVESPLYGDTQAQLTLVEVAMRNALSVPYKTLSLLQDSGAASGITLIDSASLSGTRIVDGPSFEDAEGPEYVTLRTCRFAMAGEFLAPQASDVLVRYFQSVSVTGNGGPVRRWRFPINSKPIRQVVTPFSLVRVIQTGEAVGHLSYPTASPPLIDTDFLVNEAVSTTTVSPRPLGNSWVEWPTRWNYVFEMTAVPSFTIPLPAM